MPRPITTRRAREIGDTCPHCGEALDVESLTLRAKHGPLACPACHREGCDSCMPSGRHCICPECEEARP